MSARPKQAYLRTKTFLRDHGKCVQCGLDTVRLIDRMALKRVKPTWLPAGFDAQNTTPDEWRRLAVQYVLELWGYPRAVKLSLWTCDHRVPLASGGSDELHNCQTLCLRCDRIKTTRFDIPRIAKTRRKREKADKHRAKMAAKYPFKEQTK